MLFCSPGVPELAAEIPDIQKRTRAPAQQGSAAYVQFVATLKRVIAPVYDQKIRRIFFSCLRHLEVSDVKKRNRYATICLKSVMLGLLYFCFVIHKQFE